MRIPRPALQFLSIAIVTLCCVTQSSAQSKAAQKSSHEYYAIGDVERPGIHQSSKPKEMVVNLLKISRIYSADNYLLRVIRDGKISWESVVGQNDETPGFQLNASDILIVNALQQQGNVVETHSKDSNEVAILGTDGTVQVKLFVPGATARQFASVLGYQLQNIHPAFGQIDATKQHVLQDGDVLVVDTGNAPVANRQQQQQQQQQQSVKPAAQQLNVGQVAVRQPVLEQPALPLPTIQQQQTVPRLGHRQAVTLPDIQPSTRRNAQAPSITSNVMMPGPMATGMPSVGSNVNSSSNPQAIASYPPVMTVSQQHETGHVDQHSHQGAVHNHNQHVLNTNVANDVVDGLNTVYGSGIDTIHSQDAMHSDGQQAGVVLPMPDATETSGPFVSESIDPVSSPSVTIPTVAIPDVSRPNLTFPNVDQINNSIESVTESARETMLGSVEDGLTSAVGSANELADSAQGYLDSAGRTAGQYKDQLTNTVDDLKGGVSAATSGLVDDLKGKYSSTIDRVTDEAESEEKTRQRYSSVLFVLLLLGSIASLIFIWTKQNNTRIEKRMEELSHYADGPMPKAPGFSAPKFGIPKVKVPKIPGVSMPEVPDVKLPDLAVPNVELPDVKIPNVKLPGVEVPRIDLPNVELPNVAAAGVSVAAPSFSIPGVSAGPVNTQAEKLATAMNAGGSAATAGRSGINSEGQPNTQHVSDVIDSAASAIDQPPVSKSNLEQLIKDRLQVETQPIQTPASFQLNVDPTGPRRYRVDTAESLRGPHFQLPTPTRPIENTSASDNNATTQTTGSTTGNSRIDAAENIAHGSHLDGSLDRALSAIEGASRT